MLVIIGVRPDGTTELIAGEDGYRESTESWRTVLRDLKARGMAAPVVAVGDGALGFWAAVPRRVAGDAGAAVLGAPARQRARKLPKRLEPQAKRALHEIINAPTRAEAETAITAFVTQYKPKYPQAGPALTRDQAQLLTFVAFPAEHRKHLRTTNVIESPFATVRLRQRVTKSAGSRTKGLLMADQLLRMAEERWRPVDGPQLLPPVHAWVQFTDGVQVERKDEEQRKNAA
jgi:putative transposase